MMKDEIDDCRRARLNRRLACAVLLSIVPVWAARAQTAPPDPANASASATEADGHGLADIVVTARKRSESLISVPVAVTVLGGAELSRNAATDISKIAQLAPQVIVTKAASGNGAAFNIRGIGSSPLDAGLDQSVAVNLDGLQISRGRIIVQSMFDLAQVEVLKGPQALFFGKNSPAGVISLISASPTNHFEASIKAGYEFVADERYVEATVGGPVADGFKARLAVRASKMAGYVRNVSVSQPDPLTLFQFSAPGASASRQPGGNAQSARLTLVYEPSNAFDITLKALAGRDRGNSDTGAVESFCAPGVVSATYGVPDPTGDCKLNRVRSAGGVNPALAKNWPGARNGQPYTSTNDYVTSVTAAYHPGPVSVTSITGYSHIDYAGFDNFTFTTFPEISTTENEKSTTFSQELRAVSSFDGPVNFTAGAYYEHSRRFLDPATMIFYAGVDPATGKYHDVERPATDRGHTISGFGQLRWNIFPQVELAGGARWTHEVKSVDIGNSYVNPAAAAVYLPAGKFIVSRFSDSNISPEATISWHPTKTTTLYAAYKTGYKSGGFSNPGLLGANFTAANIRFGSEKAKGGEIGYKAELFNRKLRVETALYDYEFSNLQLSSFDASTFSYFVRNAGKARTKGIELSSEWRATDALTLHGSLAYNHARYISFKGAQCPQGSPVGQICDLSGRPLTRAPSWVGGAGATYDVPLAGRLMIGLNGDTRYSSSYFTEETLAPIARQRSFWLFNAGIKLYDTDNRWALSLIGRNLGNKYYISQSQDMPGGNSGSYVAQLERPREIIIEGSFRF